MSRGGLPWPMADCWITRRGCALAWTTNQASPVGTGGKRRHPRGDENTGLGAERTDQARASSTRRALGPSSGPHRPLRVDWRKYGDCSATYSLRACWYPCRPRGGSSEPAPRLARLSLNQRRLVNVQTPILRRLRSDYT